MSVHVCMNCHLLYEKFLDSIKLKNFRNSKNTLFRIMGVSREETAKKAESGRS